MSTTEKLVPGAQTTLLGSELNSLGASGWTAAGAIFDNTPGATGDGCVLCDIELVATLNANPTANTGFALFAALSQDGTNYEDVSTASITNGKNPLCVLPYTQGQTTTRVTIRAMCPEGKWKPFGQNQDAAHTLAASGNTIKIRPVPRQSV